jgi:hypothetical protein
MGGPKGARRGQSKPLLTGLGQYNAEVSGVRDVAHHRPLSSLLADTASHWARPSLREPSAVTLKGRHQKFFLLLPVRRGWCHECIQLHAPDGLSKQGEESTCPEK